MRFACACLCALVLSACGGGDQAAPPAAGAGGAGAPPAMLTQPVTLAPCATCKVITVTMHTDDKGNYFVPDRFEAHEGDIVRFSLAIGVHNGHFLPDSNPGRKGLPPAGPLLQLPGQTHDVALDFGTGEFYFQCDPHAALGMIGHVKVEKKEG